jgi:aquaporin Z
MYEALRWHWPEYMIEAAGLGLFMVAACGFGTLLEYPYSPVRQAIADPVLRRFLMGLAMALTAVSLIYSPWGKQSGAHFNPAVTLTFVRLGKVTFWDAWFYVLGQFIGGVTGVLLAGAGLGAALAQPPVHYVVTLPGRGGVGIAFAAEVAITFLLMSVILSVTNTPRLARYTGLFAGALVATYITVEAPLSGMSMNPARTFASAMPAQAWTALWVYFSGPLLGMFCAAEVYVRRYGRHQVLCAKLHHQNTKRCIFAQCGYRQPEPALPQAWQGSASKKVAAHHRHAYCGDSEPLGGGNSETTHG